MDSSNEIEMEEEMRQPSGAVQIISILVSCSLPISFNQEDYFIRFTSLYSTSRANLI